MENNNGLTGKERELVAVGASVAAGCQRCTAYHVKAARTAGVCDRSLALVVETAIAGRNSATIAMDEWAGRCQGARPEIDAEFRAEKQRITELTAIATAVAVNSVPDLERHLAAARESGIRPEQIRYAVEIARKIKRTAEDKIDAILTSRLESDDGAGCCGSGQADGPAVATGTSKGCGCR